MVDFGYKNTFRKTYPKNLLLYTIQKAKDKNSKAKK